jgi:hypothetical protein
MKGCLGAAIAKKRQSGFVLNVSRGKQIRIQIQKTLPSPMPVCPGMPPYDEPEHSLPARLSGCLFVAGPPRFANPAIEDLMGVVDPNFGASGARLLTGAKPGKTSEFRVFLGPYGPETEEGFDEDAEDLRAGLAGDGFIVLDRCASQYESAAGS